MTGRIQIMKYMIDIDLETQNECGGAPDCPSGLHQVLGPHFDLTVHKIGCGRRNSKSVSRPPSHYWDDNDGSGYTLEKVAERLRELQTEHVRAYARRCRKCGVDPNLPVWD